MLEHVLNYKWMKFEYPQTTKPFENDAPRSSRMVPEILYSAIASTDDWLTTAFVSTFSLSLLAKTQLSELQLKNENWRNFDWKEKKGTTLYILMLMPIIISNAKCNVPVCMLLYGFNQY